MKQKITPFLNSLKTKESLIRNIKKVLKSLHGAAT